MKRKIIQKNIFRMNYSLQSQQTEHVHKSQHVTEHKKKETTATKLYFPLFDKGFLAASGQRPSRSSIAL